VFSIKNKKGWIVCDNSVRVVNPMGKQWSTLPHLVLFDGSNKARFFLESHNAKGKPLVIKNIQRERTCYRAVPKGDFWDAKAETAASKVLQAQLGGIHPASFLLLEFLQQHGAEIKKGRKVILQVSSKSPHTAKTYRPIIERFFKPKPISKGKHDILLTYELSMEKKRVKQALGIQ
ncbi:MAG: hypothetical protein QGI60_05605, partial [archaeon]|nr:hypothetical protein [archaeon]